MTSRTRATLGILAVFALGMGHLHADETEAGLQPYQMVRSLQLVQDRIADGDHAALPMQRKLLEMIDGRFRGAADESFTDRRNVHALMIYAMSGGNPSTIADVLTRLDVDEVDRQAAAGVLGYILGDVAQARSAMASIDPNTQPPDVGAFLFLVKGSVVAGEDAATGLRMLDQARLLSPGTLIEEAALRRSVTLAVNTKQVSRFFSASEQYARRYLRSPYASQFAEAFVSGLIMLRSDGYELARVEEVASWMTREQARTVYLRLARRGAIEVDKELLEFAARKASELASDTPEDRDLRSELYSSISSVTSETVEDVLARLRSLDQSRLSESDRALLNAAKAVAEEVVAPVMAIREPEAPPLDPDLELDLDLAVDPEPAVQEAAVPQDAPAVDELVTSARSRLDAIDRILQETNQ